MNLYQLARKIHRLSLFGFLAIGLIMWFTGVILKYPEIAAKISLDLGLARYIHNQMSPVFSIFLFLMTLSGIVMYVYPMMKRR